MEQLYMSLHNIPQMERIFADYGYYEVIANMLNLQPIAYNDCQNHRVILHDSLLQVYTMTKSNVTGMADIDAIIDWCCIKMLSENNILVGRNDIRNVLDSMRREKPSSVRYHVDVKGNISYLILSNE